MKATLCRLVWLTACLYTASFSNAQIPALNSYPAATAVIYLDFDGQYITGTSWNWGGPIDAEPAQLPNGTMLEVFYRISEDYSPFNINITTDSAVYNAAPVRKRIRLIITPTSDWYGTAGGVAYIGSFQWGDETPAWIFSQLLGNNAKFIAEASSHELGHTLGLHHQSVYDSSCNKLIEYDTGRGEGEVGWAPIMGLGYYRNRTTWHVGASSAGCNILQNDLDIIAGSYNNIGYRNDDHGDGSSSATNLNTLAAGFAVNGLINRPDDVDAFKLQVNGSTHIRLSAVPQSVGTDNAGANIDIAIAILDMKADTVRVSNPFMQLNAGIDAFLNSGTYYITVKGAGDMNHSEYGSLGFYSLSGELFTTLAVRQFILTGRSYNGSHSFNWNYISDEPVKHIIAESSPDGIKFQPLVILPATAKTFSVMASGAPRFYRFKAVTFDQEKEYYSNIITLGTEAARKKVILLSANVRDHIILYCAGTFSYQLFDVSGRLLSKGDLLNGTNYVAVHRAPAGILLMRLSDGVVEWTEKIIKQ